MYISERDCAHVLSKAKAHTFERRDQLCNRSRELRTRAVALTVAAIGGGLLLSTSLPIPLVAGVPVVAGTAALGALHYYQSARAKEMARHAESSVTSLEALDISKVKDLVLHLQGNESDLKEVGKWASRVKADARGGGMGV